MENTGKYVNDPMQMKIRRMLGLPYITKRKLDRYSSVKWLLRDICENKRTSKIHNIGWENPEKQPHAEVYRGFEEATSAPTSGSFYNLTKIIAGDPIVEYDFNSAYTKLMKNYPLACNTIYEKATYDMEKILERFSRYDKPRPYENMKTFVVFHVEVVGTAKEGTFADVKTQGMLKPYGRRLNDERILTEIELKILFDFYDITSLVVKNSYTYATQKDLLADYFKRIEPLQTDAEADDTTKKIYKSMRTRVYGVIGQQEFVKGEEKIFQYPIYNRAYAKMVTGIFRDRMLRYEQKYIFSPYDLVMIRTDGLYFKREVPEFEALVRAGAVKKETRTITAEEEAVAVSLINNRGYW